jgi:hypothetical protein
MDTDVAPVTGDARVDLAAHALQTWPWVGECVHGQAEPKRCVWCVSEVVVAALTSQGWAAPPNAGTMLQATRRREHDRAVEAATAEALRWADVTGHDSMPAKWLMYAATRLDERLRDIL